MLSSLMRIFLALTLFCLSGAVYAESAPLKGWKVINYWSITCAPCRIEIPELNVLHQKLASQNVKLLGVNFDDDDRATTLRLVKRMGIEFPTLTRDEVEGLALSSPNVLPTTYILNPENHVKAKLTGVQTGESIEGKLSELMNEK